MKIIETKFTAFSLSELLVTLIITILVMSFALFCLQYIQERFVHFKLQLEQQQELTQFERYVWKDIHHYTYTQVRLADSSFVLSHPLKTVHYNFKHRKIIREGQLILKQYDSLNFYYSGKPITQKRFDAFSVYLSINERSLMYFFSLPKSVQLYIPE